VVVEMVETVLQVEIQAQTLLLRQAAEEVVVVEV
jgi:hypothetical protein